MLSSAVIITTPPACSLLILSFIQKTSRPAAAAAIRMPRSNAVIDFPAPPSAASTCGTPAWSQPSMIQRRFGGVPPAQVAKFHCSNPLVGSASDEADEPEGGGIGP